MVVVPSCHEHNHDQSKDIEYARNVLAFSYDGNTEAKENFEVAKRSLDRSVGLFYQTFGEFEEISFEGAKTGIFKVDLERFKSVMRPIAHALYFKGNGHILQGDVNVFVTGLKSREDLNGKSKWEAFRNKLRDLKFDPMPVPQPRIFQYGVHAMDGGFVLRFLFYETFEVHCWGPGPAKVR